MLCPSKRPYLLIAAAMILVAGIGQLGAAPRIGAEAVFYGLLVYAVIRSSRGSCRATREG